jgi:rSAM/selenodomain-associated transferase 1
MPGFGIGLMCKPPRPGVSKTRLAREIGFERAAALSRAFLIDSIATLRTAAADVPAQPYCFFKPLDSEREIREFTGDSMKLLLQDSGDLGATMLSALRTILKECRRGAMLIGADVPTLPVRLIREAFRRLQESDIDAVFGPSEDGGYYLVAIKNEAATPLFCGINWSTSTVMRETRGRASDFGLRIAEIESWYDVDDISGLDRLVSELSTSERIRSISPASATRGVLGIGSPETSNATTPPGR